MSEELWLPVEVQEYYAGFFVAIYRNNRGEEFVDDGVLSGLRGDYAEDYPCECWQKSSGDRPGCKQSCPIYNVPRHKRVNRSTQ